MNQAKGSFDGPRQAFTIGANDQLLSSDEYRPLVVAYRNGAPVQPVRRRRRRRRRREHQAGRLDERRRRAVIVNIQRQPGANIIEVVDRVKQLLPQLQASLPGGGRRSRSSPTAPTTIRASVEDVQFELMLTVAWSCW